VPSALDLSNSVERSAASVSARRSTWTVWNVRAEAERLLRAELPFLPAKRHRELAEAVSALAFSPTHSLSAEAPARLDEPAEPRRADGRGQRLGAGAPAGYRRAVGHFPEKTGGEHARPEATADPMVRAVME
jgi:hypothetical protein